MTHLALDQILFLVLECHQQTVCQKCRLQMFHTLYSYSLCSLWCWDTKSQCILPPAFLGLPQTPVFCQNLTQVSHKPPHGKLGFWSVLVLNNKVLTVCLNKVLLFFISSSAFFVKFINLYKHYFHSFIHKKWFMVKSVIKPYNVHQCIKTSFIHGT